MTASCIRIWFAGTAALMVASACVDPGDDVGAPLPAHIEPARPELSENERAPDAMSSPEAPSVADAMAEEPPVSPLSAYAEREAAAPAGQTRPKATREETEVWVFAVQQDDLSLYENYLQSYPDGAYAGLARSRIDSITNARSRDQAAKMEVRDRLRAGPDGQD